MQFKITFIRSFPDQPVTRTVSIITNGQNMAQFIVEPKNFDEDQGMNISVPLPEIQSSCKIEIIVK